ncbi:hypothetical protein NDU88_000718 [Pleurodeles waltl]|uniref:Uncharacterized protein n=1 Tax=Pleurodeles waltl TaxID=8319 RepID=A0AAV7V9U5_PLEWA|nr:hypothetical protein NDU88_000718 [Pleurodeles waltl]
MLRSDQGALFTSHALVQGRSLLAAGMCVDRIPAGAAEFMFVILASFRGGGRVVGNTRGAQGAARSVILGLGGAGRSSVSNTGGAQGAARSVILGGRRAQLGR